VETTPRCSRRDAPHITVPGIRHERASDSLQQVLQSPRKDLPYQGDAKYEDWGGEDLNPAWLSVERIRGDLRAVSRQ
jgi:hypothetical protein